MGIIKLILINKTKKRLKTGWFQCIPLVLFSSFSFIFIEVHINTCHNGEYHLSKQKILIVMHEIYSAKIEMWKFLYWSLLYVLFSLQFLLLLYIHTFFSFLFFFFIYLFFSLYNIDKIMIKKIKHISPVLDFFLFHFFVKISFIFFKFIRRYHRWIYVTRFIRFLFVIFLFFGRLEDMMILCCLSKESNVYIDLLYLKYRNEQTFSYV